MCTVSGNMIEETKDVISSCEIVEKKQDLSISHTWLISAHADMSSGLCLYTKTEGSNWSRSQKERCDLVQN